MLLPAAATYIRPADLDVESVYGAYHGLWPQHTLDTWSTRAPLRLPAQVRDDEGTRRPNQPSPNEGPPRYSRYVPLPPPPPPPPYTELPPTRPADEQQVRTETAIPPPQMAAESAKERRLRRLKTRIAAFGHQVKTRWGPAALEGLISFLAALAGLGEDGKPLRKGIHSRCNCPARSADRQQVRKKPVKPQPQTAGPSAKENRPGRLKTNMAALGHKVKTRWGPAVLQEVVIFFGYSEGYDEDRKSLTGMFSRRGM
ncbi:uncharacterized protein LTR77_006465 [Saxophila tyrrhenica]|uniref:Uncharacterized protein n=1 Tax=Saxophila tyrrhenica TaxID=1690608 RepID=A0AAV9P7Y8_9PEZI|nr:hypothetical protein LTR77_006465 [Saxophila tyrrhenica]